MFIKFLKKLQQQVVWLLVVALVLLAAYVSIGREFMPAVARYADFFERQIAAITGLPVNIDSLTGSFQGFNPSIRINGLQLLVDGRSEAVTGRAASALELEHANLIIDIPRSIWQRRWVFEEFVVQGLAIAAEQTEAGGWQLHDIAMSDAGSVDPAALYQAFLQVTRLDLQNVRVDLTSRNQNSIQINNGSAVIQNRDGNHFLHINAQLENSSEPLALSVEVRGDRLQNISGLVHVQIPEADYSGLLQGETFAEFAIQEISGGGKFWMQFSNGRLQQVTSSIAAEHAAITSSSGEVLALQDIGGNVQLLLGESPGNFDIVLAKMQINSSAGNWAPFNAQLSVLEQQSIRLKADLINLSLLKQMAVSSGVLSESAAAQLSAHDPRGELTNLDLHWPLAPQNGESTTLRSNLQGVDLKSVSGSPGLWGIDGYLEVSYDPVARIARGFGEVESNRFRINIPSVFEDTWEYDYVNGRLDFHADLNDGEHIAMVSTPVLAQSAIVDGRVQFASRIGRFADGRREAELDLLVGVLRVDVAQKAPYLPNAPNVAANLKQTMQWLNDTVLDGSLHNSGVIFRGSTLPGSSALAQTFQSFYVVEDGVVQFSPEWPQLTSLSGLVFTNDDNIDIAIGSASSMDIAASEVVAVVRRNEEDENWLDISGEALAPTAAGLAYLQATPISAGLREAMSTWQAEGELSTSIDVRVPLTRADADIDVRLEIALANNSLTLPDYALHITDLTGPVVFDTRTGLESSSLTGKLFANPATINLSSRQEGRELQNIVVSATGAVTPAQLIDWPMQSSFVKTLLADMHGQFGYTASVEVSLAGDSGTSLTIDSTLQGTELTLPAPFAKTAEVILPLHLELQFDGTGQQISGTFGPETALQLRLQQGVFQGGLLALGENYAEVNEQINTETRGLAVLGQVDFLEVDSWVEYLSRQAQSGSEPEPSGDAIGNGFGSNLGDAIAFIDINTNSLQVYGQQLPDVGVRIDLSREAGAAYWNIELSGDAVSGTVQVPLDNTDYLRLDLAHLHLPGAVTDTDPETTTDTITDGAAQTLGNLQALDASELPEPEPRIDVLASIDPRELPKLRLAADEVSIGERPFGAWRFQLDPTTTGAEVSDLAFDFRGLRLGDLSREDPRETAQTNVQTQAVENAAQTAVEADSSAPAVIEPHFSWYFDGTEHSSALTGVLYSTNIADVLTGNGIAPSLDSESARFEANVSWPGTPAFFAAANLSGDLLLELNDGRFQQEAGSSGALKLISIINFDAIMRRLRFSDDLLRRGLAYDSIDGNLRLDNGRVTILDRLVISGPSSLYQISGELNLADQTINGEMYLTLPVSANIPWLGLLTANLPLAVGAYLFDRIFGNQVNNLTSAVYTLQGPWEGLQPQFKQAFGSPGNNQPPATPETAQQ